MIHRLGWRQSLTVVAIVAASGVLIGATRPASVPGSSLAATPTSFASLLTEKEATLHQEEARAATASRAPKTPPAPGSLPTASPVTWPSGIQDTRQPPPPGGFTQLNEWDGLINGQHVGVHAGVASSEITGTTAPRGPGLVIVTATGCGTCTLARMDYPDPGTVGPLKITSVRFPRIMLRDADGRSLSFDALKHTFSS